MVLIAVIFSRILIKSLHLSTEINSTGCIRYQSIDGLRGLLAISVFVHHVVVTWFYLQFNQWKDLPSNFYNQLGETSVSLFFMITAFLFFGRLLDQARNFDWKKFFISRFFRIYPLYFVALLVVYLTVLVASGFHLNVSLASLVYQMVKWARFDYTDINQVVGSAAITAKVQWSLLYESVFYLVLLPSFWLVLVIFGRLALVGCLVAYFAYLFFGAIMIPYLTDIKISCFFGGIFTAYYVREFPKTSHHQLIFSLLALLALGFVLITQKTAYAFLPLLFITIFFTIISSGTTLFGVLLIPSLLWLGEISYSIYLLHGIVLYFVLNKLFSLLVATYGLAIPAQEVLFVLMAMLCAVIVVCLASASFWFVERYGIALGKKFLSE